MQTDLPSRTLPPDAPKLDTGRISVVIPVHNGAALLPPTLRSVFDQTSPPGEVIVVDDGSTDGTAEVAAALGARVISQSKRGPAAARNAGTRAATGDYVAFLDADDLWTPDKLEIQFAALVQCEGSAFSFTDFRVFDGRGLVAGHRGLASHPAFRRTAGPIAGRAAVEITPGERPALPDNYLLPSSLIVRRDDILRVGGFDETIRIGLEDYELFLRLFALIPALIVMRPLLLYRRHDKQLTSKAIAMKTGFFEVQSRVAAAPHRYPAADVRHIAGATFLHHYRIGIEHARIGEFDAAIARFGASIEARPTLRARLARSASRACSSAGGRRAFGALRALWKSRPRRR